MRVNGVSIVDTFAEAFPLWGTRLIITGYSREWALAAAHNVTGFATSIIGCGAEAGIERELTETPDGRPGFAVLLFAPSREGLEKQLLDRVGQSVMTCPSTSCFNGLDTEDQVNVGGKLRFFGDGWQASKVLGGRRHWRIPVMDGEFLVEERFGVTSGVGGGNFLILAVNQEYALQAACWAVDAIAGTSGVILPFPGGVVRSGSKVGSRYKGLGASTNTAYCPTLRGRVDSELPPEAHCVLEVVLDGLDQESVTRATAQGVRAACRQGVVAISAGNYGGKLGKYHIRLHEVLG